MGLGAIVLLVLFVALLTLSMLRQQVAAPRVLAAGAALATYLILSVIFNFSFPYRTHNVSIYVVFFIAVILILAGGVGTAVRLARYALARSAMGQAEGNRSNQPGP